MYKLTLSVIYNKRDKRKGVIEYEILSRRNMDDYLCTLYRTKMVLQRDCNG